MNWGSFAMGAAAAFVLLVVASMVTVLWVFRDTDGPEPR